ncbi:MAG: prolipoprotein diacylglyceryl transferase [Bacteroidales bacterium]|nr:prolipoprotein diacylglyceryl transferase [Bacteroidales bacterium]
MLELLYIHWNANPVMLQLGDFGLRWYSFGFLFAFVFGYLILTRMFKRENVNTQHADSLVLYMFLAVLIGARLGHCLFYEPSYYLTSEHWWEMIIPISDGHFTGFQGLASHGAACGILIALWLFYKRQHINTWWVLDRICIIVALGGAFVRMGNFMNSEIWGYETTLPWGVIFERDHSAGPNPRHPTQLYESISYLLIFAVSMAIYMKKNGKLHNGRLFGWWLVALFMARILLEFTKVRSVDLGQSFFSMGQWLSVPFVLLGLTLVVLSHKGILQEGIYTKGYVEPKKKEKKK